MSLTNRNFICSRTAEAFLRDQKSHVKLLKGCVGSGKSSACIIHIYMSAMNMPRGKDGIRRSRWAITRSTYSQLKTTTIKTWQEWFPSDVFGKIKADSPMSHHIKHDDIDLEVLFMPLENEQDIERLKSLELTGCYINEVQFIEDFTIITTAIERTSRYPGKILGGGLGQHLLIMDCNPPSTNHWIYRLFEVERPESWACYNMPSALIKDSSGNWMNNPEADFIDYMENKNYWLDATVGASEEYINVSLCGKYGITEAGRAVHPEYNDQFHYTNRLIQANDQVEIGLGWDFGNTPACAVIQMFPDGQIVTLYEFWTDYMSVRDFAANIVIPQLDRLFPFWRNNYVSRHDPAGQSMNADGGTCQSILREVGIISMPADSNSSQFRRDAAKYFLTRLCGGKPGIVLTSNCPQLREGLMGKFKYDLIKSSMLQETKYYQEKPLKNMHSHICEAWEYILTYYASNIKNKDNDKSDEIVKSFSNHFNKINRLRSMVWQQQ